MPNIHVSIQSTFVLIQENLKDRYGSGFPILKELIQNAEDAKATTIRLAIADGWAEAENPLLRVPGILVANDGQFTERDADGIRSFAASAKGDKADTIGRFGFGQKAVFHWCDAFVAHAVGHSALFSEVINPCRRLVPGSMADQWDSVGDSDLKLLETAAGIEKGFLLWIPLRREDILPAPKLSFTEQRPNAEELLREFIDHEVDLRLILSALRHLDRIEIASQGGLRLSLTRGVNSVRMRGPSESGIAENPKFHGRVTATNGTESSYVGREAFSNSSSIAALMDSDGWPTEPVFAADGQSTRPKKASAHGAVVLTALDAAKDSQPSATRVEWGVFLPMTEAARLETRTRAVRLLLHGYFFVDSGRQNIDGFRSGAVSDGVQATWNRTVRDEIVLPLIPSVLLDALTEGVVDSDELASLVAGLGGSEFGRAHSKAITARHSLVRVPVSGVKSKSTNWIVVPAGAVFRAVPAPSRKGLGNIEGVFPGIGAWARSRGTTLVCGPEAALLSAPATWGSDELAEVLQLLTPEVFHHKYSVRTTLLAEFLDLALGGGFLAENTANRLLQVLRQAIEMEPSLASDESLARVLAHLPGQSVVQLPPSARDRFVLRTLATAETEVVCVRAGWVNPGAPMQRLAPNDAAALIESLAPLMEDDAKAEAAGVAALAIVSLAVTQSHDGAVDKELLDRRCLPVRKANGAAGWATLAELLGASREGRLFSGSPQAQEKIALINRAVPSIDLLIVRGAVAEMLSGMGPAFRLTEPTNESFALLVLRAIDFGSSADRSNLLAEIFTHAPEATKGLRALAAGDIRAAEPSSTLIALKSAQTRVDTVALQLFATSDHEFLVDADVSSNLTPRQRERLQIAEWDDSSLGRLLVSNANQLAAISIDDETLGDLLKTSIPDADLRKLPVFTDQEGRRCRADELWREVPEWPIPSSMYQIVRRWEPNDLGDVFDGAARLIRPWSPQEQLKLAISQPAANRFAHEIVSAAARVPANDFSALKQTKWIPDVNGRNWSPEEVLSLQPDVYEAARACLIHGEGKFISAAEVSAPIRENPEFVRLQESGVFPDENASWGRLLGFIGDESPSGYLGRTDEGLPEALSSLARAGMLHELPGPRLLLQLLRRPGQDPRRVVRTFDPIHRDQVGEAVSYFGPLTEHVKLNSDSAWSAYVAAFKAVCAWPSGVRKRVLGQILVRTAADTFRRGDEVVAHGHGVAPSYLLHPELSRFLPRSSSDEGQAGDSASALTKRQVRSNGDPTQLIHEVVEGLRPILRYAAPHVPHVQLALLVGVLGRSESFVRLVMEELSEVSNEERSRLWRQLEEHVEASVLPDGKATVQRRRESNFVVLSAVEQNPGTIDMETLSGKIISVPTQDLIPLRALGSIHNSGYNYNRQGRPIRKISLPISVPDSNRIETDQVTALCLLLAEVIVGVPSEQHEAFSALSELAEECARPEQTTIERVRNEIKDQLPRSLAELKPKQTSRLWSALDKYSRTMDSLPNVEADGGLRQQAKEVLWRAVEKPEAQQELLSAIRSHLSGQGYDIKRVLFELFQNADDAYVQAPIEGEARFLLERDETGEKLVVTNWGRLINHGGVNPEEGRRLGWKRDLFNMLQLNMSEKRDGVTGRFGLGFKSVHLICREIGVASGYVSCRIRGGMLPEPWDDGRALSYARRLPSRAATLVELVTDPQFEDEMGKAASAFIEAGPWLPALSRAIRIVEVAGRGVWRAHITPTSNSAINVVTFSGLGAGYALALSLTPDTTIYLHLNGDGPTPVGKKVSRLWQLAPLEETVSSGWLINSWSFRVDPGRGRLAGTTEEQGALFTSFGEKVGNRLVELHDLLAEDWPAFSESVGLVDSDTESGFERFFERLVSMFSADLDDPLVSCMHHKSRGIGKLISERRVLPTGLPQPFARFLTADSANYVISGALSQLVVESSFEGWRMLETIRGASVSSRTADLLEKLEFKKPSPFDLLQLLQSEIGADLRIDPELAGRIGRLIPEQRFLALDASERDGIHALLRQTKFLMEDGTWRKASLPPRKVEGSRKDELTRVLAFAPSRMIGSSDYAGPALGLYNLATQQSGFQRTAREYAEWVVTVFDQRVQAAVLRYILEGDQGSELASELSRRGASWIPATSGELRQSSLVDGWSDEDLALLLSRLYPDENRMRWIYPENPVYTDQYLVPEPHLDLEESLESLYGWWQEHAEEERDRYAETAYPVTFDWRRLGHETGPVDREAWFTFFALGIFRTIGRTTEAAHRGFLERALSGGWWHEMAEADLPHDPQPWIDRLEAFADARSTYVDFPQWRRAMVDLYVVARWLPEYVDAFRSLPLVAKTGDKRVSLADAWRLSASPIWQRRGLEGAPLTQSLGLGANWLIREAIRNGIWPVEEARLLYPYAWSATDRVKEWAKRTGSNVLEAAEKGAENPMDVSPTLYEMVRTKLGERADFLGDLDLPLQLRAKRLE